jgi:bifunctional polynucleotide phosphatase/kinase
MKPDPKAPKSHQSKLSTFKTKAAAVLSQLDLPMSIYAATEKDIFRKPRSGMWKELLEDYDIHLPGDLDLEHSFFVGDAGGRTAGGGKPKDFSCSDRYSL